MGDMQVGSEVLTPNGSTAHVLGISERKMEPVYRVTLSDGSSTKATGGHLWEVSYASVDHSGDKPQRVRKTQVLTTEELLKRGLHVKRGQGIRKGKPTRYKFQIPSTSLEELLACPDLPIDPYVLGVLLGDGSIRKTTPTFSSADPDIVEEVDSRLGEGLYVSPLKTAEGCVPVFSLRRRIKKMDSNPITESLRELGLHGLTGPCKFIPPAYMMGSYQQRLDLLRGLMDTDGTSSKGGCLLYTTSPQLAEDTVQLVRSLGGWAKSVKRTNTPGEHGVFSGGCGYIYYVTVVLSKDSPFHLSRKSENWTPNVRRSRSIESIELVGEEEAQCILIDDPRHLYVTDDYIATHNTNLTQLYAASCLIGGQDVWGSVKNFNRNYIRKEKVWITTKIKKNGKEEIGKKPVFQTTGYKNLAQPLDSKILTPSGWRNIGSLELGDEIIDSQGKVQTVEYINDRGVQDVWEVKLRDGSTARAAGDHLWTVRNIYGNYVDLLTTELTTKYARPVSIDMPRGQMKGTQEPLVDPYFMGYMLGDGHLAHGLSFTCHKDEVDIIDQFDLPEDVTIKVATQFENYAAYRVNTPKGIQPQECSECGDTSKSLMRGMCRTCYSRLWYRGEHINKPGLLRNSLLMALEESGIQGRVGVTKVLPNNWNSWSFGNRLALLQGLLDSDGSATLERRRVTHVSVSPGLADGVRDLARSVGLVSYQTKIHRESSRDVIHTHILWDGRVRLFRGVKKWDKLTQAPPMNTQRTPRSVVSVTRVEDSPVRCIGVSSPDSLYITDNYLLTHNSHFKKKFDPMSIRITYEDIADDVTIPALVTEQVYLDMTKKQRDRYTELQGGVRTILGDNNMPDAQKAINALTAFTIGSQICAGTFALKTTSQSYEPDGPEASPKLDWIMDKLTDDWTDEKVVVYAKFRGSIIALQKRLEDEGIGFSTIWGVETDADVRNDEMTRFWEDPDTKVMIISVSGERSLNLQNASILVMWDLQLNPARVAQIAGRVRRVGSTHKRVFVFELLMSDTQEERYMAALAARQTLFDFVYDVDTEGEDADNLLIQKLDTEQILRLIQP